MTTEIKIKPLDPTALFEIRQFTDDLAGTIVEKYPVQLIEGRIVPDPVRQPQYAGQTYINGQPLNFVIQALTLAEAMDKFSPACETTISELQSQILQNKIAKASRSPIVIDAMKRR